MRLEPIILELEREQNDLLIIAHESVLRVLYGYLMHCSTMDIPKLKFPRDEIIEIIPAAYQNEAKRLLIPGLDPRMVAGAPEDIEIPAPGPASGNMSPIPVMSTPQELPWQGLRLNMDGSAAATGTNTPSDAGNGAGSGAGAGGPGSGGARPPEKVINTTAQSVVEKAADVD